MGIDIVFLIKTLTQNEYRILIEYHRRYYDIISLVSIFLTINFIYITTDRINIRK